MLVLAAIFSGALVYSQAYSTFPIWVRDLGLGEKVYGFLQGLNGILVVVFELAVTAVAMRYPRTRMIALGILLTGLGFAGFGIFVSGLGMALAVTVWSFGEMFGSPSAAAFVADRAPAHRRGRYQSALGSCTAPRSRSDRSRDPRSTTGGQRYLDRLRCIRCDRSSACARG